MIQHSFSNLLRRPKEVTDDVEDGVVLLRRRDEPDLHLLRADRAIRQAETFDAIGRLVRALAVQHPAAFTDALGDAFPWVDLLPARERGLFVDEFSRAVSAAASIGSYEALHQLVHEWRATAEIHADPKLARRLRRPIARPDGAPVPRP